MGGKTITPSGDLSQWEKTATSISGESSPTEIKTSGGWQRKPIKKAELLHSAFLSQLHNSYKQFISVCHFKLCIYVLCMSLHSILAYT